MKTRKYETLVIARPELEKDQIKDLVSRLKARIERHNGQLLEVVDWGIRKLAYPILVRGDRFFYANYFLLTYLGNIKAIQEIENYMKLIDETIRFQTVLVSDKSEKIEAGEVVWREQVVPEVRLRDDGEGLEAVEPARQRKLSKEEMYRKKPIEKVAGEEERAEKPEKEAKAPEEMGGASGEAERSKESAVEEKKN